MNPEAPQRIDLSQDIQKQGLNLTAEQENSFREYMLTLEREERERVLYMTREDLQELRDTIDASSYWENDAQSMRIGNTRVLSEFIDKQATRGLTLSDMLTWAEHLSDEVITLIQTESEETLFWNEWIMQGIELTDRVKSYITTALWLSVLDQIKELTTRDDKSIAQLLQENTQLQHIQDAFRATIPWVRPYTGKEDERIPERLLRIDGQWEHNQIFMNIWDGKKFFDDVFSWSIDSRDAVIQRIHAANTDPEGIEAHNLQDLTDLRRSAVDISEEDIRSAANIASQEMNEKSYTDMPPEKQVSLIERWKESGNILLQILASLLEFGKELTGNTEKKWDTKPNTAVPWLDQKQTKSLFERIPSEQLWNINPKRLEQAFQNGEYKENIEALLKKINTNMTLDSGMKELFWEDRKFARFRELLRTAWHPKVNNSSENSPARLFQTVLEEYVNYRTSEWVADKTTWRTTWEEYINLRKQNNWESDGE